MAILKLQIHKFDKPSIQIFMRSNSSSRQTFMSKILYHHNAYVALIKQAFFSLSKVWSTSRQSIIELKLNI